MNDKIKLDSIEDAIADFKEGKFLIVVDDEDRENEGDFIIAAEKITPEKVNFMLKHARGVLCAPITLQRCKELDLDVQVSDNTSSSALRSLSLSTSWRDAPLVCRRMTVPQRSALLPIQMRSLPTSDVLDTSILFMRRTRVCFAARGILRRLSTLLALLDCILPAR